MNASARRNDRTTRTGWTASPAILVALAACLASSLATSATAGPGAFDPDFEHEGREITDHRPHPAAEFRVLAEAGDATVAVVSPGPTEAGVLIDARTAGQLPAHPDDEPAWPTDDAPWPADESFDEPSASSWSGGTNTPATIVDGAVSLAGWMLGHHGVHHGHHAPVAWADDCPPVTVGDLCNDCPTWTGSIDALMLWQGGLPSRPLYVDSLTGQTVLGADDLRTAVAAAPRYGLIYHRDACRSFEMNYFAVWGFAGGAAAAPTAGPMAMNNLAGLNFDDITAAQAESSGHIKSLEFNLRRTGWGGIRWLSGFRWVEWGQQLTLSDVYGTGGGPAAEVLGVSTLNNLYGWQWGGDAMLWNAGGKLRINGIGKAGVFANAGANQTTTYVTPAGITQVSATRDVPAFFGEVGINGSYSITNWLAWRAGYTFFWLGGVANPVAQLSTTQIDPALTPTAVLNPWGSALIHGATTGLEARW
jgi:hypothetical protein